MKRVIELKLNDGDFLYLKLVLPSYKLILFESKNQLKIENFVLNFGRILGLKFEDESIEYYDLAPQGDIIPLPSILNIEKSEIYFGRLFWLKQNKVNFWDLKASPHAISPISKMKAIKNIRLIFDSYLLVVDYTDNYSIWSFTKGSRIGLLEVIGQLEYLTLLENGLILIKFKEGRSELWSIREKGLKKQDFYGGVLLNAAIHHERMLELWTFDDRFEAMVQPGVGRDMEVIKRLEVAIWDIQRRGRMIKFRKVCSKKHEMRYVREGNEGENVSVSILL